MSGNVWGQRSPHQPETGVAQVLAAYASRGGWLLGARRWLENPLTLTHVRWQGTQGEALDAVRQPDDDARLSQTERDVWVHLALGFPSQQTAAGPDAPWAPLSISPQQAAHLAERIPASAPGLGFSEPRMPEAPTRPLTAGSAFDRQIASDGPAISGSPTLSTYSPTAHAAEMQWGADASSGVHAPPADEIRSWTGSTRGGVFGGALHDDGVTVLPCVEVELPMLVTGPAGSQSTRNFARDVAHTFEQAVHVLPQVRETRGWMRGERLVLAARMVVAPGTGIATAAERDDAARLLADALARRTLPYAHIGYAEPGEWVLGRPLPE
jgi:hypothetical protein